MLLTQMEFKQQTETYNANQCPTNWAMKQHSWSGSNLTKLFSTPNSTEKEGTNQVRSREKDWECQATPTYNPPPQI